MTLAHGIVAWLDALLLLVVASQFLRQPWPDKPWLRVVSSLASLGAWIAFASGMAREEHYRVHLRQHLFIASKSLGWLYERKMHLSFGALLFATIGVLSLLLFHKNPDYFRAMRASYVIAAICALSTCVISSIVGFSVPSFRP